jgi:hypothetical protein
MSWAAKLAKPLKPRDHAELRTLADARDYMLTLPPAIADWQAWQQAGKLLLAAANETTKATIAEATDRVERALFLIYREELSGR